MRFVLIGCGKNKQSVRTAAESLYTGSFFLLARKWAESTGHPWAILSAKYGLLFPDDQVDPYDLALKDAAADERRAWGVRVAEQLARATSEEDVIVHAAGRLYSAYAEHVPNQVEYPVRGMSVGWMCHWFSEELKKGPKT